MSGICSIHRDHDPSCRLCNTDIRQLLPDYDKKLAEAITAGEYECWKCSFVYYKTTLHCPKCGKPTPLDEIGMTPDELANKLIQAHLDGDVIAKVDIRHFFNKSRPDLWYEVDPRLRQRVKDVLEVS